MSEGTESKPTIYYIPENFLGESRIFGGRIRVRYLVDSIILSLILAMLVTTPLMMFVLKGQPFNVRIAVIVISVAPGFLLGQIGYNGDPISVFFLNLIKWARQKQTRLFNETPRLLGTDPVKALYENNKGMDKVVNFIQETQEKRIAKKNAEEFIEGETFEFQYDPGIDGYTEDVGDYSDASLGDENTWPVSDLQISSGGDLGGLASLLMGDGYNEPEGFESESYDIYLDGSDTDDSDGTNASEGTENAAKHEEGGRDNG